MLVPRLEKETSDVLDEIRRIIGPEHVRTSDAEIESRSRCTIPWERTCRAVVYPGSREEVRQIVRAAGACKTALWVFSRGKNWGYGTTMAVHDGAIVVMLERLDRILEVNEELGYAVIEPGVTYRQLNAFLKEREIKLWTDCTDGPPDGSVVGNALERGIGETPYGDHFGNICGMEVVLPNGDIVRTGGGPPDAKAWHVHKWGTGPYLEGLFSQSNFGIVTKMGLWLMPQPEAFSSFIFEIYDERDLPAVIDAVRRLAFAGAIQSKIHMINDFVALAVVTQYPYQLLGGASCLSDEAMAQLREEHRVAPWTFGGGLYGSAAQIRVSRALIKKELSRYGRLAFFSNRRMLGVQQLVRMARRAEPHVIRRRMFRWVAEVVLRKPLVMIEALPYLHAILQGAPTDYFVSHAYFKSRTGRPRRDIDPARDGCGLMWAGLVVPLTGRHLQEVLDLCRPLYRKHGFDPSFALIVSNPRSLVALTSVFYDKADPAETERAWALYDEICAVTLAAGYQQYRTSVAYMDRVLRSDPDYRTLLDAIKSALDPSGVLAPGRYGIGWSKVPTGQHS